MSDKSTQAYYDMIHSGRRAQMHERIMDYFMAYGAGTIESIAMVLQCKTTQISPRLSELDKMGLIKSTALYYRSRYTNRLMRVWVRADKNEIKITLTPPDKSDQNDE